jgi:holo-[acyl-carrier protein] synthase
MHIGLGTDLLKVSRVGAVYSRFGVKFARKILAEAEFECFEGIANPRRRLEFLAGRFAAKEAIFKASSLPENPLTWSRVSLLRSEKGSAKPIVYIDCNKRTDLQLSLSHDDEHVFAVAISCQNQNQSDLLK